MIETDRINSETGEPVVYWEFTPSEEGAMAKFVMDCLCLPWIDTYTDFYKLLRDIFYRGSNGWCITLPQARDLADKYKRYFKYGLPAFPKIREGGRMMCPKDVNGKVDTTAWLEKEKASLWRDQWENHYIKNEEDPDDHSKNIRTVGGYWKFPGDDADEVFLKKQRQHELLFWDEVTARHAEYGGSRRDTIIAVSDYMRRAESENQLPDPSYERE